MSEIIDFIKENIKEIGIVSIFVVFLLVAINATGVDLNVPKPESTLVQQVTVETFETNNEEIPIVSSSEIFCESYLGNSIDLEKGCNELTESKCGQVKCCVYGNNKCVAGNMSGPTYKTDKDGKLITMDYYYYLGKCHGTNCPI